MSAANREALEQRLAKLLGISTNEDDHEYVTDIFNSLVDIGDNTDDVVEYLTNFGGDGNLRDFAIDLKKFKDGDDDDIILSSATDIKEDEKPPAPSTVGEPKPKAKIILDEAAAQREEIKRREVEAREKQRMEQEFMKKKKMEEEEEEIDLIEFVKYLEEEDEKKEKQKRRKMEMEKLLYCEVFVESCIQLLEP